MHNFKISKRRKREIKYKKGLKEKSKEKHNK